jgi:hypothetical protein
MVYHQSSGNPALATLINVVRPDALRRTIDGDPNAETPQDKLDTDEINRGYVAEAKELLADLAKHDSATFTRHQNLPGWQATNVELAAEKDAEITRLRERAALLDSFLGEALRHKYIDESECSPRWLVEAKEAVTDLDKFKNTIPESGAP